MFTGIVEEVGSVRLSRPISNGREMWIDCNSIMDDLAVSDSVSIDGVCQTVTGRDGRGFRVQAVGETLDKTTLGSLVSGAHVNLEQSLRPDGRIGGHFVQGHVQGVGLVDRLLSRGNGYELVVRPPLELMRYIVREGSITVSGVSLTVAGLDEASFAVNLIPYSADSTTLSRMRAGDRVNIEVDIIGRYVERLLLGAPPGEPRGRPEPVVPTETSTGLTIEQLNKWGYR